MRALANSRRVATAGRIFTWVQTHPKARAVARTIALLVPRDHPRCCGVQPLRRTDVGLLADNLYHRAFSAAAVEFAVEDLFPRAEIEFAFGDGDDHFAAHDLALEVGIGVVFAGAIVPVGAGRRVRRQLFQPDLVVVMEPALVVVDEHGRGDVHGVNQTKAFAHAALTNEFLNLRRDVDEPAPAGNFKPEIFGERFHAVTTIRPHAGEPNDF